MSILGRIIPSPPPITNCPLDSCIRIAVQSLSNQNGWTIRSGFDCRIEGHHRHIGLENICVVDRHLFLVSVAAAYNFDMPVPSNRSSDEELLSWVTAFWEALYARYVLEGRVVEMGYAV